MVLGGATYMRSIYDDTAVYPAGMSYNTKRYRIIIRGLSVALAMSGKRDLDSGAGLQRGRDGGYKTEEISITYIGQQCCTDVCARQNINISMAAL